MLKPTNANRIYCGLFGVFVFIFTVTATFAQKSESDTDKNIELNIVQERITETDFECSTNVSLNQTADGGGLNVEIGVGVRAERINVLLRGIYGRATFRARFEAIRQRFEQRKKDNSIAPVQNDSQP